MSHEGSIVGIAVASSEARTAGTATFEVYKNGSTTGLTTVLDGTDPQFASSAQAGSLDTFIVGDRLDVRVTTDGSWAPVTADVEAAISVSQVEDWTTFTPTLEAVSTNPTIGNGTLSGKYRRVGNTVEVAIRWIFGSTSNAGSGLYSFTSLPFTVDGANDNKIGAAWWNDSGTYYTGVSRALTGDDSIIMYQGNLQADHDSPFVWGTSDEMIVQVTYETA
jgi:hypothetical protein